MCKVSKPSRSEQKPMSVDGLEGFGKSLKLNLPTRFTQPQQKSCVLVRKMGFLVQWENLETSLFWLVQRYRRSCW